MTIIRNGLLIIASLIVQAAAAEPVKNILLVTYDGLRWQEVFSGADAWLLTPEAKTPNVDALKAKYWAETPEERREKLLPFLWGVIAKQGQLYGDAERGSTSLVTNGRHFSYPGYNELLTGFGDTAIDSNAKRHNANVTVLEWLNNQPTFRGKVAAFTSWDVFPFIINTERSGLHVNAGWDGVTPIINRGRMSVVSEVQRETPRYWAGVRFDVFTHNWAVEYIQKERPRVIYIGYGETDDWAHDRRYDLYLESASQTDDYIRRIWEMLQSMRQYAGKTALLVSTDHGRGDTLEDWGNHGAKVPTSERIWIAALGPGIPAKGVVSNTPTTQSQYATTAAAVLGQDFRADNPKAVPPIELGKP